MRLVMIALILVALLAAGGAAVMVKRILDSQAEAQAKLSSVKVEEPAVYVLVADETVPIGTTLTQGALRWQKWPDDNIGESFISAEKEDAKALTKLVGATMRQDAAAGTPITEEMVFRRGKAGFLAGMIADGMRAVSVAVDATSGAAGFILPGDRVDVVLTFNARELARGYGKSEPGEGSDDEGSNPADTGPAKYTSETVLQNLRVLAIDQNFKGVEGEAEVAKNATLEVDPKQAEVLTVARAMGKI